MMVKTEHAFNCMLANLNPTAGTPIHQTIVKQFEKADKVNLVRLLRELGVKILKAAEEAIVNDDPVDASNEVFVLKTDEKETIAYIIKHSLKGAAKQPSLENKILKLPSSSKVDIVGLAKLIYAFKAANASYPFAPPTQNGISMRNFIRDYDEEAARLLSKRYSVPFDDTVCCLKILMVAFAKKDPSILDPYFIGGENDNYEEAIIEEPDDFE
ncbi:MAG: hypothetical protein MJZ34_13790 [Paludibacteraceae bacterium]|nr:hypothetical protein [Paludibacteraceae bacterium]